MAWQDDQGNDGDYDILARTFTSGGAPTSGNFERSTVLSATEYWAKGCTSSTYWPRAIHLLAAAVRSPALAVSQTFRVSR